MMSIVHNQTISTTTPARVLVVLAGGTIGHSGRMDGGDPRTGYAAWDVLRATLPLPSAWGIEVDGVALPSRSLEGAGPAMWVETARLIENKYADYDGFVVTDEISLLPYHASALSYMIQDPNKPIILTGANTSSLSGNFLTDNPRHLLGAVWWASWRGQRGERIADVSLFFGDRLLQGNRAVLTEYGAGSDTFAASGQEQDRNLSRGTMIVRDGMRLDAGLIRLPAEQPTRFNPAMNLDNALLIDLSSGITFSGINHIELAQSSRVPALLVDVAANYRTRVEPRVGEKRGEALLMLDLAQEGRLVCVRNQCQPSSHEAHALALAKGLVPMGTVTRAAAWTKLGYAMGQQDWNMEQRKRFLERPFANDMGCSGLATLAFG